MTCTENDSKAVYALGLCRSHYDIKRRRAAGIGPKDYGGPGAWYTNKKGYVVRKCYDTITGKRTMEQQHRVFMAEHLGRALLRHEEVHHKNGNRSDNRLSNLELWSTKQPKGQRVQDKVDFALEILALYAPDQLAARIE